MAGAIPLAATSQRLRLKRWFLLTLVISLSVCAFVAVLVLLLGEFNDTTVRILLTVMALALHSGVALACAAFLEARLWPQYSGFGLVLFAANFALLVTCIWWPGGLDTPAARAIATTGVLLGYYIIGIPAADLRERQQWPASGRVGLYAVGIAAGLLLACVWGDAGFDLKFAKITGIAAVIAGTLAHTCLLLRIPGGLTLAWVFRLALASAWAVAAFAVVAIIWEPRAEAFYRVFGACGVIDACATLALLILAKIRQVARTQELVTAPPRLELRCPRCRAEQQLEAGNTACTSCGLKIRIRIEEPRCAKCDYRLWNLPERRCPECGTEF